jgi:N-alpha-acetyltransferase 50
MTSSKKALSSKVTFASLTQNNLGTVRRLNSVLFPIKYSEKFYSEILSPEVENFCKLSVCRYVPFFSHSQRTNRTPVYYNDIPVGTICCRIETKENVHHLYLLTMGVLAVRPD